MRLQLTLLTLQHFNFKWDYNSYYHHFNTSIHLRYANIIRISWLTLDTPANLVITWAHPLSPPKQNTYTMYLNTNHIQWSSKAHIQCVIPSVIFNDILNWLVLIYLIIMQCLQQSRLSSTDSPKQLFLTDNKFMK